MAVLTKEKLADYGPFVDFAERGTQQELRPILSLADTLLELYCSVTNSYLPFDPHSGGELKKHEIRLLAREFFLWSAHIAQCRLDANDVSPLIDLYVPTKLVEHSVYDAALNELRRDLVDTATFLATELLAVASADNTLIIDGL